MKILISESQLNVIIEDYYNDYNNQDDWYEFKDQNIRDILSHIRNKKIYKLSKIPAMPYKKAIEEFVKYGHFIRFPENFIHRWKGIVLENIATLSNTTELMGHANDAPYDEFYDEFDYNHKTNTENNGEFSKWCRKKYKETGDKEYITKYRFFPMSEFLDDVYHMDDYLPTFSNGAWFLSDFGLKPLFKLGQKLITQTKPEDMIVTINKILDITHARSDLAEVFIEGGSATLNNIAGYERNTEYHGP